jgi:cell division protein FtsI/penicillin-binding protein 2
MKSWRFYTLVFFIGLVFAIIIFRLFSLQVLKHSFYRALANNQHQIFQTIYPFRGEIFMRDRYTDADSRSMLFPVAINKDLWMVYAVPKDIEEKEETVKKLSPLLEVDEDVLEQRINKPDDPYEPLKNKVDEETAQKIKELNLKGIHLKTEGWRYFPANELACHLMGFVGFEGDQRIGRYGIEEYYEKELSGKSGFVEAKIDSLGELISIGDRVLREAKDGADLILTIDPNVQFFVEEKLKETIENLQATGGVIIVMETKTGAIKAMASWPGFDLNKYNEVEDINLFLNPAVQGRFEPGSIFKPITVAAALDKGVITPRATYEDKGKVEISGHILKNAHEETEGIQTMTQVLEKSLNTGAVFIQQRLGKDDFKKYVEKFGFDDKTGIDLTGEIRGDISNLRKKKDLEYATAAFGQGIAITPIQLISALSAIGNDGILLRPYVVEKIIFSEGEEKITEPKEIRRVISSDTASRLTAMLVSVVKNGYGKKAGVSGYLIAGKTGTAQIPEPGGYSEETIHCFGGFLPALDPYFAILIKIDRPQEIRFAADSIAPVFSQVAEYILNYYEIPPSQ